jgi:hypothetical protein
MLAIHFEGWFQCRLATDPDPSDEARGISGWTFSVAGEPDLDRVIRLHDPLSPRSHCPPVGLTVRAVTLAGAAARDHPLLGARVGLLDEPQFEGRNGIAAESGQEPIVPFHLQISGRDFTLRRDDPDDDAADFRRRQPVPGQDIEPAKIADVTGIRDFDGYRQARRRLLEAELADLGSMDASSPKHAALRKRIAELSVRRGIQVGIFNASLVYRFAITGPTSVTPTDYPTARDLDMSSPWPIEFWMGAWDADALSGYMQGTLEIPLK